MKTGLMKLYNSEFLDPNASNRTLQYKVMFDVCYYFCRRGNENIHEMTKTTFNLIYDQETKMTYVKCVENELIKNHKEVNAEIETAIMPQILDENGIPH